MKDDAYQDYEHTEIYGLLGQVVDSPSIEALH